MRMKPSPGEMPQVNLAFGRDQESGWFVVHVAELPGCVSQGETLDEAKSNIADAIESFVEVLLQDAIQRQPHNKGIA